jgi:uncharacterized protein (TIGR02145 family)
MRHKKVIFNVVLLLGIGLTAIQAQTVKDINGNVYKTVTIGTQTWMAGNLKTIKFNDGTAIPLVTNGEAWSSLSTPGYCWYNNDAATYKADYGALYNWYAVNTGKLCPLGWHVSTNAEWNTLISYLGGESVAGGKLKEIGTTHWLSPNNGATNKSGFTALPGGYRIYYSSFYCIVDYGYWWSFSEDSVTGSYNRGLSYYDSYVDSYYSDKRSGYSVRCLQDY